MSCNEFTSRFESFLHIPDASQAFFSWFTCTTSHYLVPATSSWLMVKTYWTCSVLEILTCSVPKMSLPVEQLHWLGWVQPVLLFSVKKGGRFPKNVWSIDTISTVTVCCSSKVPNIYDYNNCGICYWLRCYPISCCLSIINTWKDRKQAQCQHSFFNNRVICGNYWATSWKRREKKNHKSNRLQEFWASYVFYFMLYRQSFFSDFVNILGTCSDLVFFDLGCNFFWDNINCFLKCYKLRKNIWDHR